MNRYVKLALASMVLVASAETALAVGAGCRHARAECCQLRCCPTPCRSYANPCICPQDALLSYWTGANWYTLYSADRHDEECGSDNGTCASPQPVYITGSGLSYPQDCTHPTYPCSIVAACRGAGALKTRVPWSYVPAATADPAKLRPHFITAVNPTPLFRGYLKFEPSPGKAPVTAIVFRYLVPQHNHASDPNVPQPPRPNAPQHDCDERIVAFGFEVDATGSPTPLPGNPVPAKYVVRDSDLYHVRAGGSTYGIVAVARP